ncbi:cytochrome C oxidase subunit IV family protein [Polaribacter uvawellassae]|uniref:cytochrome C oxidase subunit IV family protein n=1 Tax=Polaribacter uvawellassae TaxID=3133495 RepID=UPI003219F982
MTRKNLFIVWILLLISTVTVVFFSSSLVSENSSAALIILISVLKFLAVSFYFMEMKNAHVFWKASIIIYLLLFSGVVLFY